MPTNQNQIDDRKSSPPNSAHPKTLDKCTDNEKMRVGARADLGGGLASTFIRIAAIPFVVAAFMVAIVFAPFMATNGGES